MSPRSAIAGAVRRGGEYTAMVGSEWPLTGRAEELELITGALDLVDSVSGVLLAGPAGVGKTRLAREALTRLRSLGRDCRSFVATSSARTVPLGVFAELAGGFGPDPLRRVQEVVAAVTSTQSSRPVVIGIDDVHLLDDQSAMVIHQLIRRHLAVVVLTTRSGETAPDAITALWKDELMTRLDLQPLSVDETAALLRHALMGEVAPSSVVEMWRYTRGNALYLRQLLADEIAMQRFSQRAGVWLWQGGPELSPSLVRLVEATIARQSPGVIEVLDVLAIADPLELSVLAEMVDAHSIDGAQAAGLISIDTETTTPLARLGHPLFGEVRRNRAGTMRLRELRGRTAAALHGLGDGSDLIQTVRRGVLTLDSDRAPDRALFSDAAVAALKLMDPATAERLARRAAEVSGGRTERLLHLSTLIHCERLDEALVLNAELIDTARFDHERVLLCIGRAAILEAQLDGAAAEQQLVAIADLAAACGLHRPHDAVAALVAVHRNRLREAIATATAALNEPGWFSPSFALFANLALVAANAGLGLHRAATVAAEAGKRLARNSIDAPAFRLFIFLLHAEACRKSGYLAEAAEVGERLARECSACPNAPAYRLLSAIYTTTTLAQGDLPRAHRLLEERVAGYDREPPWKARLGWLSLAMLLAMSGDHTAGAAILAEQQAPECGTDRFEHELFLAQAWVSAAAGARSEATTLARKSANLAQHQDRPAQEVMSLQTATQFGDRTTAVRLAELATVVEGPRVLAAARHAAALRDNDGPALQQAARMYEEFGDRIAAADAAAQAAVIFRKHGYRGAALTATAFARGLASACGADTLALRANNAPIPLTERQYEIIALVAAGLSNRQIADRLVMSVRTVEGHLFRASQKTGLNSREELTALIETPNPP